MSSKLALLGGNPIRTKKYPLNITTDEREEKVVLEVLRKGVLSDFEGTNNEYFLGGEQVQSFEREWAEKFLVKHAISFNSATSALFASIGACEIGPGDEVVVTPFTMTATPAAILAYNAIPVFSDVEMQTYNLDPEALKSRITSLTKAIFVVHIFGNPVDMDPILDIAKKHNLKVIEDAAQAPNALYRGKFCGTIGDIGVYSLNSNKVIQCGEGGIAVTDDDQLAERLRLIRNHAESVIASGRKVNSLVNMLGWNYRMNEIEAAIGREQLRKLDKLTAGRLELVNYLNEGLKDVDGIDIPFVREGSTHVYYRYALKIDSSKIDIPASLFVRAMNAEGMDFYVSYMKPLYLQPLFQEKIVYGDKGCPFSCPYYEGKVNYDKGICPNAEKLDEVVVSTEMVRPPQTKEDMDEIISAIKSVVENKEELVNFKD